MWLFYIELFTDDGCYGDFVEAAQTAEGGIPVCADLNVAKSFTSPEELNTWVLQNTSLKVENEEYGIKGVFYHEKHL